MTRNPHPNRQKLIAVGTLAFLASAAAGQDLVIDGGAVEVVDGGDPDHDILDVEGRIIAGQTTSGTLQVINAGRASSSGETILGEFPGSFGTLVLCDPGTALLPSAGFTIGASGRGIASILGGASLVTEFPGVLADSEGSLGVLGVFGPGSTLIARRLEVGLRGEGLLTIGEGGTVLLTTTTGVGRGASSVGRIHVDGQGSRLVFDFEGSGLPDCSLIVGQDGDGLVEVTNGAELIVDLCVDVGREEAGTGIVRVVGDGSSLQIGSRLYLGVFGEGTLEVLDGAQASLTDLTLGGAPDSSGHVLLSGPGSSLDVELDFFAGDFAGQAVIEVRDGAALTAPILQMTSYVEGSSLLSVSGAGARVDAEGINVALDGPATLRIEDGGMVAAAQNVIVGSSPRSDGTVELSNASMSVGGQLTLGHAGEATLRLLDGAIVETSELTMSGSSHTELELTEAGAGGDRPALIVTGLLHVAGTLTLTLDTGYEPEAGDAFDLFDFDTIAGELVLELPDLGEGLEFDTSMLPINGTIRVVAGCPADLNSDGLVNTQDFVAFLNAWASREPLADWDQNGLIDTRDFIAYLNDWAAGC